ncbi:murein biosynthesis integral membrane protein MurJ [Mumia sp. zg.B53]|uniref:murein biosynthesis integral membrane protein MurJ n=1 Tax=unclassified Mumia TaxID=2621872 RepID=UPI001C6F4D87|nr:MULTISPECIES: murein biosynthesis integral membrane protein MurJ [unclassified Mumia]MBW9209921.1 murein biosynthesis integral membrane protein MurJ [Mumia sp. zg.B21]MBW9214525.1 murein biosynthesis integral membrane protein MurJ [Mumia sp. zg.B53]MDD9350254.1 murein biosynthesis integral membrane protein MurJ [Mumia sp.]
MSKHRRARREKRRVTPVALVTAREAPLAAEAVEATEEVDETSDAVAEAVRRTSTGLLSASVLMAAGTLVSRLSGFVRSALIFAAIGASLNADIFTGANTIPNALYVLLAGGVFNVVLVPQLVRAMKNDSDGGEAYAQRIITLGLLVLGISTVVLVIAAPLLVRVVFDSRLFDPGNEDALSSAYALMRYCLPQIFFYGAFVLVGQILNSRGRFGPMMWAPIVNNLISCAILVTYIVLYGESNGSGGFTGPQELLLGVGSTVGIAAQALVLLPYLRAAGFHYRPRFDFRGVGLGHTLKLGAWTLGFILVNQVMFVVITRIGTSAGLLAITDGNPDPAGTTVYASAFLITQVPHGVITVSLVTATMPLISRLAAEGDLRQMRNEVQNNIRSVLALLAPIAVAVFALSGPLGTVVGSWGSMEGNTETISTTIAAFAPAIIFFSLHYMSLRGFYALEDTRTPFFIQIVLATVNIGLAVTLASQVEPSAIAPTLAVAYGGAYLVGSLLSITVLSTRIGPVLDVPSLVYLLRLVAACVVTMAVMLMLSAFLLEPLGLDSVGKIDALLALVGVGGIGAGVYLALAWLLRIREVTAVVRTVLRR